MGVLLYLIGKKKISVVQDESSVFLFHLPGRDEL